jgi:hypothetical protein
MHQVITASSNLTREQRRAVYCAAADERVQRVSVISTYRPVADKRTELGKLGLAVLAGSHGQYMQDKDFIPAAAYAAEFRKFEALHEHWEADVIPKGLNVNLYTYSYEDRVVERDLLQAFANKALNLHHFTEPGNHTQAEYTSLVQLKRDLAQMQGTSDEKDYLMHTLRKFVTAQLYPK